MRADAIAKGAQDAGAGIADGVQQLGKGIADGLKQLPEIKLAQVRVGTRNRLENHGVSWEYVRLKGHTPSSLFNVLHVLQSAISFFDIRSHPHRRSIGKNPMIRTHFQTALHLSAPLAIARFHLFNAINLQEKRPQPQCSVVVAHGQDAQVTTIDHVHQTARGIDAPAPRALAIPI